MINKNLFRYFLIGMIFLIPLVSAYSYIDFNSPAQFFDNEWFRFVIIESVLFAVIYFAVTKTFKDNKPVAAVVALGVSLLISVAISERGLLYSYTGDTIGNWAIIIGLALVVVSLFKVLIDHFGGFFGIVTGIAISLVLFTAIDLQEILPSGVMNSPGGETLQSLMDFGSSILGLGFWIVVIIIAFYIIKSFTKKAFKKEKHSKVDLFFGKRD